jgi:hypothetical protein
LSEDQVGRRDVPERASETDSGPDAVHHRQQHIERHRPTRTITQPRFADAVDGNRGIVGDRVWQPGALVADEIDEDLSRGKGTRVVLHAGTAPEIPDDNDSDAHLT